MNRFLINVLLILFTILTSCKNRSNIVVQGKVLDAETGQAIPNAEVVVLCWYMNNIDDASFKNHTVKTDKNGKYQVKFDNGHQVDIAAKATNYQPSRSYNELSDNKIEINLKLKKSASNPTILTLLNIEQHSDSIPFLRIRIYENSNGKGLDYNNMETYGFDLKTFKFTTDTSSADFWFKIEKNENQPTIIQTAKKGGIFSISSEEIMSSFLYEKRIAPIKGYNKFYTLKENDEGFFIRCKDGKTYAKIILEKSRIELESQDAKGLPFKELGRNFSCLYQPNGSANLAYPKTDINLEDFLVDSRQR